MNRLDARALGFLVAALAAGCTDPYVDASTAEIIGGELATSSQYPSVVGLEGGPGDWFCTGTLIHERFVLTAAHCVEGETTATLKIRLDDEDLNDRSGGTEVAVTAIHGHPGYDGVAWDNDIAIVELAAPATGHAVTPIHRTALGVGTSVTQVGYGDADDAGGGAGLLRRVDVVSIDCATVGDPTVSGTNLVCFDGRTGHTTCYGDSGGPTFVMTAAGLRVAGVTSGGTADLCTQGFDLETAVAAELDFVDQYVPVVTDPPDSDDGGCCSSSASPRGLVAPLALLALAGVRRRRARGHTTSSRR